MNVEKKPIVVNDDHQYPKLSWSAILGGVVLTLAVYLIMALIGISLGLSSIDFEDGVPDAELFSWASGLWYLISVVLSLFAGGYVAGRFSGNITHFSGVFNGLMVWALASFVSLYMVGAGVSKAGKGVGKALHYGASSIDNLMPSGNPFKGVNALKHLEMDSLSKASKEFNEFLEETDNEDLKRVVKKELKKVKRAAKSAATMIVKSPDNIDRASSKLKNQIKNSADKINSEVDKKEVIAAIAQETNMSEEEVRRSINEWNENVENWTENLDEKFKELKEESLEFADDVTESIALVSGLAALTFILGALSAAFGGFTGRRRILHESL